MIVVGAGVAGLTAVEHLTGAGFPVTLVTTGRFGADTVAAGNTALAQGGIAAALGADDSPALHLADTLAAGAGLVDPASAQILTTDGTVYLKQLLDAGFQVDRDAYDQPAYGLEAAHSRARVVHAGEDSTGAALSAFLTTRVQQLVDAGRVQVIDQASLRELVVTNDNVTGLIVETYTGVQQLHADAVILATGGYAGLFPTSSSSPAATGQGLVTAAKAGAVVADMEFVQFHPTALAGSGELLSEAVRGAGAVLRDPEGQRFMPAAHPAAELAPRDVVSRKSFATMQSFESDSVFLDATVIEDGSGALARRFPQLTAMLQTRGIDWTREFVPVAPAAHYCMGGVVTDNWARTSIPGLFAAGEVASTGVHGANRLASNSLLEGLVFGARAAQAARRYLADGAWSIAAQQQHFMTSAFPISWQLPTAPGRKDAFGTLQRLAGTHLGIIRNHNDLVSLLAELDFVTDPTADLLRMMATAALARTESRGGHWRADYPTTDSRQAHRIAWRLANTPTAPGFSDHAHRTKETAHHVDA